MNYSPPPDADERLTEDELVKATVIENEVIELWGWIDVRGQIHFFAKTTKA